ncbi:hypothetical protein GCM10010280_06860 [Streptomyces pilosus]|uniref:Uncharacterized protein n=1 Tax=Streptomyces pilosus TaxID=28893 RepID=A0A918BH10_9ACTN|nr:hypothetical protein GCM10010280_06860 [Streptomyces pilosus]
MRVACGPQAGEDARAWQGAQACEDTSEGGQPGGSFRTEAGEEADPAWGSGSASVPYGRTGRCVHLTGGFPGEERASGAGRRGAPGRSAWWNPTPCGSVILATLDKGCAQMSGS